MTYEDRQVACAQSCNRIAFLGDSITDDGTFIAFIENWFYSNNPDGKPEFINLGVSAETASGLSEPDRDFPRPCIHERIDRAIEESRPDLAVVCYGMNDGIYYPFSDERFFAYKEGLIKLVKKLVLAGVKVVVMSPPPFDPRSFNGPLLSETVGIFGYPKPYEGYDNVLKGYAQWIMADLETAGIEKTIDLHTPIKKFIELKREAEPDYRYGDGIHPDRQGHWVIANILLKELFNVPSTEEPKYVMHQEASPVHTMVMMRRRILSAAWKEHVGHTNPNKAASALPIKQAKRIGAAIEAEISSY